MPDINTEDQPKLDLAQRIVAALTCTDEPHPNPSNFERRDSDIVLGTVPLHLRHLHNLLVDSNNRRDDEVLNRLFWDALDTHLDQVDVQLHKKKLLSDWTVLGVPDDGRSHGDGDFGDVVMIRIGGGPAERGGGIFDFLRGRRKTH